ncbi:MAG: hypothetical protein ACYDGR_15975 [Candidatus Dormibacteria bacterium]
MKVLSAGVDSLYLSAKGELREGVIELLASKRDEARAAGGASVVAFSPEDSFLIREHGWRGYPFWLSSPSRELFLGAADPFPTAYLQLHSAHIHTVGLEEAVKGIRELLANHVFAVDAQPLLVSRADVYADQQGWIPSREDFARFVCRGVHRKVYEVPRQMHQSGRHLSGFTFGRGDILARIYDKTLELSSRGQTWPSLVWDGHDTTAPVWRVEFQFRRKGLLSFGVRTVDDILDSRQDLWEYGTRWLSLRTPGAHSQSWRWDEAPEWSELRETSMGSPRCGLVRGRIRHDNERRLVAGFVGYASSIGAGSSQDDMEGSLRRAAALARGYLRERGRTFDALVAHKRERRIEW